MKVGESIGRSCDNEGQDWLKPDYPELLISVVSGDSALEKVMKEIGETMSEADRAPVASDPVHGRPYKKWIHTLNGVGRFVPRTCVSEENVGPEEANGKA